MCNICKLLTRKLSHTESLVFCSLILCSGVILLVGIGECCFLSQSIEEESAELAVQKAEMRMLFAARDSNHAVLSNWRCGDFSALTSVLKSVADRIESDGYVFDDFVLNLAPILEKPGAASIRVRSLKSEKEFTPKTAELYLPSCFKPSKE